DADKLDIWWVVTDYYENSNGIKNSALELGFPETPEITSQMAKGIMAWQRADLAHVHNLNDLKLLQMSWIFDINFEPCFQRIQERAYIEKLQDALPKSDQIEEIVSAVKSYLNAKLEAKYHR
ncbi:MAG: HD family phosphohydrolase, partial [bacterium]|nr:HD family phosphohydrolase [bacterium]